MIEIVRNVIGDKQFDGKYHTPKRLRSRQVLPSERVKLNNLGVDFCPKCRRVLPQDKFQKSDTSIRCKQCVNSQISVRNKRIKNRFSNSRLNILKKRAINKGLDFDLTTSYLIDMWNESHECYYCGVDCEIGSGSTNLLSIDRVDNSAGYVVGNVVFSCLTCNFMKYRLTKETFLEKVAKIYEKHNNK